MPGESKSHLEISPEDERSAGSCNAPYQHQPLADRNIRLLEICTTSGADSRDPSFNVREVHIDAAPPFTAISYTWGKLKATETIRLNGKSFFVRPNLWRCLYSLSRQFIDSPSRIAHIGICRYLWVDAVCIDQANNQEKSKQVAMMGEGIYHSATSVAVWLDFHSSEREGGSDESECSAIFDRALENSTLGQDLRLDDNVHELMELPYWQRYWVLQEYQLARRIWIWCNRRVVDGDTKASKDLVLTAMRRPPSPWLQRHFQESSSLRTLLWSHVDSQCQDPRDRVFALLSLVPEPERLSLMEYMPNYYMSHEQVVVLTLAHMMNHEDEDGVECLGNDIGVENTFEALQVLDVPTRARLTMLARAYANDAAMNVLAKKQLHAFGNGGSKEDYLDASLVAQLEVLKIFGIEMEQRAIVEQYIDFAAELKRTSITASGHQG